MSPRQNEQLLENLSTAVLLFDAGLRLRFMNVAAEDLLSLSARQSLGLPLERLLGRSGLGPVVRRALDTGQRVTKRNVDLPLYPGRSIVADCTVSAVADATGTPEAVLVELGAVERHQRAGLETAQAAQQEAVAALVRGMAHEVKNPLGGIRGAAQLLQRELHEPRLREYTRIVIQEADRLRSLVDRMLGPPGRTQRSHVNVHEITERVAKLLEAEAPAGVVVVRDYDPSLPPVYVDGDQVLQAVLNVARNAVQALGAGPGRVTLRTRAERKFTIGRVVHRLAVRIDVADDGPGIPPEIEDSVFFPLVSGRVDGTGLGLPIAQNVIHRQNGRIAFRSQPGCTVFSIWLPTEDAS